MCRFDCKRLRCQVILKDLKILFCLIKTNLSEKSLKELVKNSDILDDYVGTNEYENRVEETTNSVKKILEYKKYINVFKLQDEQDIEMAILRALLKCII